MSKTPWDMSFQDRRCDLGFHNFINFMDSPIDIEYVADIPEEVLICKTCGTMLTPREILERAERNEERK